ncbi:hypothetical protein GJ629_07035 [Halapricum sp. CBA1109]|uniref:DUF5518 domain-containing protein n=1 Tax=Halapricum sp. CBA1109 TaxID=2668068 RepID=UPI0012F809D3|nr:DUF5518 domain-containing protein [Halapricum sp. CBA1109]MUV89679.1 hypothetical protein [Halapricum sp. CBA1109]
MSSVNTESDTGGRPENGPTAGRDPVPEAVDWAISGVVGLIGLFVTVFGAWLFVAIDRQVISDAVRAEGVELNGITPSEAVTAGVPFVEWSAVGIVVTGLLLALGAGLFIRRRRATRRRVDREGGTTATFWAATVYGAAVTVVTSFVPVSAAVGGGVAASLRDGRDATRVGAAAGVFPTALSAPFVLLLSVGFLVGADAIGQLGGGVFLAGISLFGLLFAGVFNAVLGAAGGWIADRWL